MVKKILLIQADFSSESFHSSRWGPHPLGLMYIAAAGREAFPDLEFKIFQTLISQDYETSLPELVHEFQPDLIGLRSLSYFREHFQEVSTLLREHTSAPIISGGPHCSTGFAELLKTRQIDLGVLGEGEETFVEVLQHMRETGELPTETAGTAVLHDGKVKVNKERERIADLDANVLPDYSIVDPADYLHISPASHVPPNHVAYLESSRGCPYKCFYCHIAAEKQTRNRGARSVVDEMKKRREELGVETFLFLDDIFNVPPRLAAETLELIAKELPGVKLQFPIGLRADRLNDNLLDLFEAAGTTQMSLAIESVTERLQKFMGKNLHIERATRMVEKAQKRFITTVFFILGLPTETKEEARETIDYAASLTHCFDPVLNVTRVYRGTLLWNFLNPTEEQGRLIDQQTKGRTTPRLFHNDKPVFYGDFFTREQVPLMTDDIMELRAEWVQRVHFNPDRIVNSYDLMQKFLTRDEIVRAHQSVMNNPNFDDRRLQQMLDFAQDKLAAQAVVPMSMAN